MNEGSTPEKVAQVDLDTTEAAGIPADANQPLAETSGGGVEGRDQEQVSSLVDQLILQYKQALRENRQRHAQEILEAARRQPEIAELLAPKLLQVEEVQKEMDRVKIETAATFRTIGNMLAAFSQDRRNMHALNGNQATELLEGLRRLDKQLSTAEDINTIANIIITLGDWAENSVLPSLNRTAQNVGEYFRGRIPPEINDEGARLHRLTGSYMEARNTAAAIRKKFDEI